MLGGFFQSNNPLPVGSPWTLVFQHGESTYELPAEVIHNMDHKGVPGIGLCLHDLGLERERGFLELLENLVHK